MRSLINMINIPFQLKAEFIIWYLGGDNKLFFFYFSTAFKNYI